MEMNVEKSKVMRNSKSPSPVQNMIDQKQLRNVEYVNYFGCLMTSGARCAHEIKLSISMTTAKFKKKKKKRRRRRRLFFRKQGSNLRKN
jgi:hypothetical protein